MESEDEVELKLVLEVEALVELTLLEVEDIEELVLLSDIEELVED